MTGLDSKKITLFVGVIASLLVFDSYSNLPFFYHVIKYDLVHDFLRKSYTLLPQFQNNFCLK